MASLSREDLVEMAKLAEQAERYTDMIDRMKEVVEKHAGAKPLNTEERNLLSVAYKNVVGAGRSSWRIISLVIEKISHSADPESEKLHRELALKNLEVIEKELKSTCHEVIGLLSKELIDGTEDDVSAKVFYYKMKGDYYRYIAEVAKDAEKTEVTSKAEEAYTGALEAGKSLGPSHAVILGLALNFSVFYYEIMDDKAKACELAKKAYDEALEVTDSDTHSDENKDSALIMQLLRDNLALWNESDEHESSDA